MDGHLPDDLPGHVRAVLDWWREAGVDSAFDDTPRRWIVAPDPQDEATPPVNPASFPAVRTRAVTAPPPPPRALIGGDPALWPTQLPEFAAWWMSEPTLDNGQVRGRVPPRGPGAAPLMVLVCEPEADDGDTLLSGLHGRLLGAMLAAMGLRQEQVYVASALPRHMPMADWQELTRQGLGEVLRHHVALARPLRLLAFSRHFSRLLAPAGLDSTLHETAPPQSSPVSSNFSHEGVSVPLLVARDLGSLLERPIAKGQFWQHWLEWSAA